MKIQKIGTKKQNNVICIEAVLNWIEFYDRYPYNKIHIIKLVLKRIRRKKVC